MHKSSPRVLATLAVGANNGRAMVHAPARTVVPLQKTPRPAAVKRHTRNKNHSPHKIATLKASYDKNRKPGENEKKKIISFSENDDGAGLHVVLQSSQT